MREPLSRFLIFCGVSVTACMVSIGSIGFTVDGLSKATSEVPMIQPPSKPSYMAVMPAAKAETLNIAKLTPVIFKAPVAVVAPHQPIALAAEAVTFTHTISVESLRVREGPIKTAEQLFALKGGTGVVALESSVRGWVRITDSQGRSGWVYGALLRPAGALVADSN